MNEEFSDYELIVAKSDGGEITQDISWKVDKETDIVVWCDIAGLMEEGSFDYNGKSITIKAQNKPFTAYIMRKECAEYVISQNSSSTFSVDVILEQLKKNVRILEQLEETDTRTLQCVDEVNPITDKDNRKGKVLSFDKDGNPVCEVEVDDVEKIKAYRDEASASATSASTSATSASKSADNASKSETNAETIKGEIDTLVDGFDTEVGKKQTEVIDAIDSHFSDITIELDEYADGTISEIEGIKNQVQALVDNAKEIVDPEGFRRDTSANISDLQLFKANKGALHFNAGSLALGSNQNVKEFCWCFRFKISLEEWKKIDAQSLFIVANKFSGSDLGFGLRSLGSASSFVDILAFQYCNTNQSNKTICRITEFSKYADEQWHSIVACGFNNEIRLYVDGSFVNSGAVELETITPARPFTVSSRGTLMQYADIYQFNFDITSEDALYTIADYQQGKPIPPKALNGTLLALEDYTITNGNSKIVFDYSGNNNDATITGDVKGDNDARVQKLINFILER